MGVEELALGYYSSDGGAAGKGWRGVHDEGSLVHFLWLVLTWQVAWTGAPPRTLFTLYQDAPLDLDACGPGGFHANRGSALRDRLLFLARCDPPALAAEVAAGWQLAVGKAGRGAGWSRYPLGLLQSLAVGLGGPAVAVLLDAISYNHKQLKAGFPDLTLVRATVPRVHLARATACLAVSGGGLPVDWGFLCGTLGLVVEAALVEVKGPRDVLSEKQHTVLRIALQGGVFAAVCKIHESSEGGSAPAIRLKTVST